MNIIEKISSFIFNCSYNSFSAEVLKNVKNSFIDTLGVTIAGSKEKSSKIIRKVFKEINSIDSCTIIGEKNKTDSITASLLNGVSLHALDFDDTGAYTQGHPSAPIFPVILALGEENENNGKEIIEAYVVGVEIQSRLSRGMPMLHLKGWHPTSVFGTVAAAGVSSKLLKLDFDETVNALAISTSLSSGLVKNFGTMTKHLHIGNSARNGILAAKLAKEGFTASLSLFNGENSFSNTFYYDLQLLEDSVNEIGNPLAIISPGISLKKYPSCSLSHRCIDAIFSFIKDYHDLIENIASIECFVSPRAKRVLSYTKPRNALEAKFSLQFVIANVIVHRRLNIQDFCIENIEQGELQKLMNKIHVKVHSDWREGDDGREDILSIRLKENQVYNYSVTVPRGGVKNPLSAEEILDKYRLCTNDVLSNSKQDIIIESVLNLEKQDSLKHLMEILRN